MAEIAINFALNRLRNQLEQGLDRSSGEEAMKINKAIDEMKGFLNDADWRRQRDTGVEAWVGKARRLAYLVEDEVDGYRTRKATLTRFMLFFIKLCTVLPFSFITISFPESLLLFILPALFILISSVEGLLARFSFHRRLKVISKDIQSLLDSMNTFEFELTVKESPARGGETSTFSFVDVVGMEDDAAKVEGWLLEGHAEVRVAIFITGAMGTGKTTLAAIVYEKTKNHFDCHAWAFLSHPVQMKDAFKEILNGFYESNSESAPIRVDDMEEEELCKAIYCYLEGMKYLLVLDDVRDRETWNKLSLALPLYCGGKVVLTTRDAELHCMFTEEDAGSHMERSESFAVSSRVPYARSMTVGRGSVAADMPGSSNPLSYERTESEQLNVRVLVLKGLSEEDSRKLFCSRALSHTEYGKVCPPHLESFAKEILSKCEYLPISIVTVGGLLSTKEATEEEWQKVLTQLDKHLMTSSKEDVFVSSGYADLSPVLKQCFLYCGIFPENYKIPLKRLVRLWVAEGFAEENPGMTKEETARRQVDQLINRNMLQVATVGLSGELEACRMLHLMSSFTRHMSSKDNFGTVANPGEELNWPHLRRLSTEDSATILNSELHTARKLRSLLYFGTIGDQPSFSTQSSTIPVSNFLIIHRLRSLLFCWAMQSFPLKFKMLRVMELQGLRIRALPKEIGDLILLRYLGLRGTGVSCLPKSLLRLVELETLDIRETKVRLLPDLHYLRKLRHLYMEGSFMDKTVQLSRGVMWLTELQSLVGAKLTRALCEQLGYLSELRKLSVGKAQAVYSKELCKSINKMSLLCSLNIKCEWGEQLDLRDMADFRHLNKLKLGGRMDYLLDWVSRLHSLCYLYLWDSTLSIDPLFALKDLKKLVLLSLFDAYEGTHLCCDEGSFPSLKKLSILHLRELETVSIMKDAMPKLEKMFFAYCPKLKEPPAGIEHLECLQIVQVTAMPTGFDEIASQMSNQAKGYKFQQVREFISSS